MTAPDIDPTDNRSSTAHSKALFKWGCVVSAAYVGALTVYAVFEKAAMLQMSPHEFATFLSGAFAPLAFLWLVLGFRQQGDELQNSARALWLQGEELRNSVEQQRRLVEVSREQLASEYAERSRLDKEEERASQPLLMMPDIGWSSMGTVRNVRFIVVSAGPTCSDVRLWVGSSQLAAMHTLSEGQRIETEVTYSTPDNIEPIDVRVTYTDRRGNHRAQSFHVPTSDDAGPQRDRMFIKPIPSGRVEILTDC
jgi:hypothetical protein